MTETTLTPPPDINSDRRIVVIVYALYLIGFFSGITAIIGVILAHIKVGEASEPMRSHLRYQIRTFWYSLALFAVGAVLALVLIGYVVILAATIWVIIRCVKGLLRANEMRPIDDPTTFLW